MATARIVLDRDFRIGQVDPRLFGGFAEHLGRCIYGGLYEPGHPRADGAGFREDVLALVRELDMPVMRYPGGNFVSGYNWEDGVGPVEERPARLDLAWKSLEPNRFGLNEFVAWCRKAGTEPMLAVNLGTRGPEEARNLVEYCNHPGGTYWSDLRRAHGWPEPHNVKLWCLGNEMDGDWQMGHKTATEYGRVAHEAAKLMKMTDGSIELVACGSSGAVMPTFGAWEAEVLDHCMELVEYISLHTYYGNPEDDTPSFLARPDQMSAFIEEVAATCDYVAAKKKLTKRVMLSFDEWNVWFHSLPDLERQPDWQEAPHLLEDIYTMEDALVVGGMLISLLNHSDRVRIGCLAQVVNVIAPIMTAAGGPAWKQTIFHPFAQASALGRGVALRQVVDTPRYDCAVREGAPVLASAAVLDPESGGLTVFAVNRSLEEPMRLRLDPRGFGTFVSAEATTLRHTDLKATNTMDRPGTVEPRPLEKVELEEGGCAAELPPASWNVLRLRPAGSG